MHFAVIPINGLLLEVRNQFLPLFERLSALETDMFSSTHKGLLKAFEGFYRHAKSIHVSACYYIVDDRCSVKGKYMPNILIK